MTLLAKFRDVEGLIRYIEVRPRLSSDILRVLNNVFQVFIGNDLVRYGPETGDHGLRVGLEVLV